MRDFERHSIGIAAVAVLAVALMPAAMADDHRQDPNQDLDVTMTVVPQNADISNDVTQEIEIPRADSDAGKDRDEAHQADSAKQHKADAADTHDGQEQAAEARSGGNEAAKQAQESARDAAESAEDASQNASQAAHDAHEAANDAQSAAEDVRRDTDNRGHGQGGGNGHAGGGD